MSPQLVKKLGFRSDMDCLILNAPNKWLSGFCNNSDKKNHTSAVGQYDFIVVFAGDKAELTHFAALISEALKENTTLWFGYPKSRPGFKSEINRDHGWKSVTDMGLRPVSQV